MRKFADIAREVITGGRYMSLGTADAAGHPWVSPVFYTPDGYTGFEWVSSPDAVPKSVRTPSSSGVVTRRTAAAPTPG